MMVVLLAVMMADRKAELTVVQKVGHSAKCWAERRAARKAGWKAVTKAARSAKMRAECWAGRWEEQLVAWKAAR